MAIVAHLVASIGIFVLLCREQMASVAHLVAVIGILVVLCREQMAIVAHLVAVMGMIVSDAGNRWRLWRTWWLF
jgi:hypothetical protein